MWGSGGKCDMCKVLCVKKMGVLINSVCGGFSLISLD